MMFNKYFTLVCFLCAFPCWADHAKSEPSDGTVASFIDVTPAKYLTPVDFYNQQGEAINFADFRGKVLLVNLWATWCGPCLRELPSLQRLANKLAGTDFKLLAISIDQEKTSSEIYAFYQQLNITALGFYVDSKQQLSTILPTDVVPASFIINRQGKVVSYMRSFADWDAPEASEMILSHIGAVPYARPAI
ncbi:TlpA disulfide reductase family protein [Thalassotalea sp. G2M2-11]|uniref:TlpA family protein disulfide reductase n=1 Tax=Thalassotalea sp. G2M2-11 TaxID=2787627 RepID=UPI0019D152E0|nr:TlpA disulfide reductase family protein [Thalassotalea sp. G2M2-11]